MSRWLLMWTLALAVYAWCKWTTFSTVRRQITAQDRFRMIGYLLAWPGMDPRAFLSTNNQSVQPPSLLEWGAAALKLVFGVILTWVVARWAWPARPLVAGWIGMSGAIFILHFGIFHLLSLAWQRAVSTRFR